MQQPILCLSFSHFYNCVATMKMREIKCLCVLKQNIFSLLVWAAVGVNVFGVWEFRAF